MSEIYHIINRGTDKRKIFLDKQDYFRFIHDLFKFNDQNIINSTFYNFKRAENEGIESNKKPRKLLVDIYAFCLMPNHYHLLLGLRLENGVAKFMQKLNMGYSKYFNQKYKRKGTLFEGRYKSILVTKEPHFYHLPYYIHFNPLDIKFPGWREGRLRNHKQAIEFLDNYRWSSHLDYSGIKNFPSVTNRAFLLEIFGGEKTYIKSIEKWLEDLRLENIQGIILE